MACSRCSLLLSRATNASALTHRTLNTSATLYSKPRRRPSPYEKWGIARFPQEPRLKAGPLVDLPDFTYLDGRPTPLGSGQLRRKTENYQLAKRIVTLVKELEGAKEKFALKQQEESSRRQAVLAAKLKQKSDEP